MRVTVKNINRNTGKRISGFFAVFIIVLFMVVIFYSITNTNQQNDYWPNTPEQNYLWKYQVWDGKTERNIAPDFVDDDTVTFSDSQGINAIKISKEINSVEDSQLEIAPKGLGIEIFIDHARVYTDFTCTTSHEQVYLREPIRKNVEPYDENLILSFELPDDYDGKAITVVYYLPDKADSIQMDRKQLPVVLMGTDNPSAMIKGAVVPALVSAECGIIVVLLLVIFLYGVHDSKYEWHILFLAIYYVTLILRIFCISKLRLYTMFPHSIDIEVAQGMGMVSLFLFLTIWLFDGWYRVAALLVVLLSECAFFSSYITRIHNHSLHSILPEYWITLIVIMLFGVLILIQKKHSHRRVFTMELLVKNLEFAAAVLFFSVMDSISVGSYKEYLQIMVSKMQKGDFQPLVRIITETIAVWVTFAVIHKFIVRILDSRQWMTTYKIRSEMAIEREQHVRESINQVREMKHEMRHHILMLHSLLDQKQYDMASEYVSTLEEDIQSINQIQFCRNMLINTIVSAYAVRFEKKGIEASFNLSVPDKIDIIDTDISMLLTNILENAMEAAEKTQDKAKVQMNISAENNMMFIEERNTMLARSIVGSGTTLTSTKENKIYHGYGLGVIKKIVKKYDGDIKIDIHDSEFVLKAYINIKK